MMFCNEPALNLMSSRLHCAMFQNLDHHFKQDVIRSLISKIGSGGASSMLRSTSLTTLETLTVKNTEMLCNFAVFAASVLDYTDQMTIDEVRRVMNILARLAFSSRSTSSASGLRDDLHIVVRKQIAGSTNRLKRMGVVGVVAVVKNMLSLKGQTTSDETTSTSSHKSSPSFR